VRPSWAMDWLVCDPHLGLWSACAWRPQDGGIASPTPVNKPALLPRTLNRGLLIACTGVGALVLVGVFSVALLPMIIGVGVLAVWLVSLVLIAWGGVELMAALERWLENDSRFQR
jgi:hypothetical protein